MDLSSRHSTLEKLVTLVIDETALIPRLSFDSQGLIIGHAINDDVTNPNETSSVDGLANRMICYMIQGLTHDLHHVSKNDN